MLGDRRSQTVLGTPEIEHLRNIRETLLDYRGRIAVILDNQPNVSIIGKVIRSRYDTKNQRVTLFMNLRIKGGEQIAVDIYPRHVRDYYLTGVKQDSPLSFEHCISRVRLLDS